MCRILVTPCEDSTCPRVLVQFAIGGEILSIPARWTERQLELLSSLGQIPEAVRRSLLLLARLLPLVELQSSDVDDGPLVRYEEEDR